MTKDEARLEIAEHCEQISKLFKGDPLVTVLVRNPGLGQTTYSADMMVTRDRLEEIRASLTYLETRPEE